MQAGRPAQCRDNFGWLVGWFTHHEGRPSATGTGPAKTPERALLAHRGREKSRHRRRQRCLRARWGTTCQTAPATIHSRAQWSVICQQGGCKPCRKHKGCPLRPRLMSILVRPVGRRRQSPCTTQMQPHMSTHAQTPHHTKRDTGTGKEGQSPPCRKRPTTGATQGLKP